MPFGEVIHLRMSLILRPIMRTVVFDLVHCLVSNHCQYLSRNGARLMISCVEWRFDCPGLWLCFTPVRSPQSNGISEAFVKTFQRDYARLSIFPAAEIVTRLLAA